MSNNQDIFHYALVSVHLTIEFAERSHNSQFVLRYYTMKRNLHKRTSGGKYQKRRGAAPREMLSKNS